LQRRRDDRLLERRGGGGRRYLEIAVLVVGLHLRCVKAALAEVHHGFQHEPVLLGPREGVVSHRLLSILPVVVVPEEVTARVTGVELHEVGAAKAEDFASGVFAELAGRHETLQLELVQVFATVARMSVLVHALSSTLTAPRPSAPRPSELLHDCTSPTSFASNLVAYICRRAARTAAI